MIPFAHGEALRDASQGQPVIFVDRPQMTHNEYNLNADVCRPLAEFFRLANINTQDTSNRISIEFLSDLKHIP